MGLGQGVWGLGAVGFRVFRRFGGFRLSLGFRDLGIGVRAVQVLGL